MSKTHQYPYFAYPVLEQTLDEFFTQEDVKLSTRRLYLKLKCCAKIYADTDFADIQNPKEALAKGWEEIHIALLGKAEYFLSILVQSIWNGLDPSQWNKFYTTLESAINLADLNTSPDASRLYVTAVRKDPFYRPDRKSTFTIVIPNKGPRLREWAIEKGLDPDKSELAHYYLEIQDRLAHNQEIKDSTLTKKNQSYTSVRLDSDELDSTPRFIPVNSETTIPRFTLIRGGKNSDE